MKKIAVFLADGFEETEALVCVDILRRACFLCDVVSTSDKVVSGSHGIKVVCDLSIEEFKNNDYDMIVLPGGMSGVENLIKCDAVLESIIKYNSDGKYICAICAGPQVISKALDVSGKRITSYPDFENCDLFKNALYVDDVTVQDGNIITSRGPATVFDFAFKLVEVLGGDASLLKEEMLYNYFEDK